MPSPAVDEHAPLILTSDRASPYDRTSLGVRCRIELAPVRQRAPLGDAAFDSFAACFARAAFVH